jgi:5-hydroxyisourate hydrolase
MGRLTTHVLDTALGRPAEGLTLALYRLDGERALVTEAVTNRDGRVDAPLLEGDAFRPGLYEIVFEAGAYHAATGQAVRDDPRFLGAIPVRFGIAGEGHYHVPLLLSPFGYSTYRGS